MKVYLSKTVTLCVLAIITSCIIAFQNGGIQRAKSFSYKLMLPTAHEQDLPKILVEKAFDTFEDAFLHTRRLFVPYYNTYKKSWNDTNYEDKRPVMIVIGSGWASHSLLKIIEAESYRVICISPRPYFIFTPMLSSTAVGTVEYRSVIEPVRLW